MEPGRRALIPYEEDRSFVPQPARWGRKLAHASWLVVAVLGLLFRVLDPFPAVRMAVVWTGLAGGFAAAVTALVRMRWEGREGIVSPALIGLCLTLLTMLLFFFSYLVPPTVVPS